MTTQNDQINNVSQPPFNAPMIASNGRLTLPWSNWFRDLYRRTAYKGGNSIDNLSEKVIEDADSIDDLIEVAINHEARIVQNETDIQLNEDAITVNAADIAQNASDISQNANDITQNAQNLVTHENLEQAHGSNGNIVGFDDLATEVIVGLVKKMEAIADAVDSSVDITTADIGAAPAAYDQAYTDLHKDLTNENKAAINQLATDLNAAIAVLNELLQNSRDSGQMST